MGLIEEELQEKRISHLETSPGENTQETTVVNGEEKDGK